MVCDVNLERETLGACLLAFDAQARNTARALLVDDFSTQEYRAVAEFCLRRFESGRPNGDVAALRAWLAKRKRRGWLLPTLADILLHRGTPAAMPHYVERLKEWRRRRELVARAERIIEMANDSGDTWGGLDSADAAGGGE